MTTKIVNKWNNTTLYQFSNENGFANSETDRLKDKHGTLLRNHTSFGFFECYTMKDLKKFIENNLKNI